MTACLTAIKNHVIKYCEIVFEMSCKISGESLKKLQSNGFQASI